VWIATNLGDFFPAITPGDREFPGPKIASLSGETG
jgi:hypothetical protein